MRGNHDVWNIDLAKSYATEDNLDRALDKTCLKPVPALVVRNRAGRFTAVYSKSMLDAHQIPFILAAQMGFKVLG
jgi:hypothetical protein